MEVQWLRLHASTAGDMGVIAVWETKIPNAIQRDTKKKRTKHVDEKVEKSKPSYITDKKVKWCSLFRSLIFLQNVEHRVAT